MICRFGHEGCADIVHYQPSKDDLEAQVEGLKARIHELETAFLEARAGRWKTAEFWAKIP
jgi:hypothetical protein